MMTLNRVKRQSSCCLISPTNDIAYFVVVYVTGASGSPYPLAFCALAPAAGSVGGGRGLSVRSAGFCARGGASGQRRRELISNLFSYVAFAFRNDIANKTTQPEPGLPGSAGAGLAVCAGRSALSGGRCVRRPGRALHRGAGLWTATCIARFSPASSGVGQLNTCQVLAAINARVKLTH